jgi:mono/diheme cytochrome c family protein
MRFNVRHGNVAVCAVAVLLSLGSGLWVMRAWAAQPRRDAERGGVRLRLEQATWLHEPMDHGDAVRLPAVQGAPGPGQRQLTVALTLLNGTRAPVALSPRELVLVAEGGQEWFPVDPGTPPPSLRPGQRLSLSWGFNVPVSAGGLRLEWGPAGTARALLLSTRPPPSLAEEAVGQARWPQRAEDLPPGTAQAGAALFHERFACVTCHGSPEFEEVRAAPPLDGFAQAGATRVRGMSAAQYAYESLLFPGAFIAAGCGGNAPCQEPSLMPVYGDALSSQEMADLISYLVGLRSRP